MKHVIHFHGSLKESFGTNFTIYADSLREMVKGLTCGLGKGFENTILEGNWHIVHGEYKGEEESSFITEDLVDFNITTEEIHFYPAIMGAGNVAKIVVGVVLIIAAIVVIVISWGALTPLVVAGAGLLASTGVSLLAAGVGGLLTKPPKLDNPEKAEVDKNASFLFNGAANVVEQGGAVPIVLGRHHSGSVVISTSIDTFFKTANANLLNNQTAKFEEDANFGSWGTENSSLEVFKGSMLVHPNNPTDTSPGSATITRNVEVGEKYTFSANCAKRKNTTEAGIEIAGQSKFTTNESLTNLTINFTAATSSVTLKLTAHGRRGHFDNVYFAKTGFNYKDSPLVDIEKATGVNPT